MLYLSLRKRKYSALLLIFALVIVFSFTLLATPHVFANNVTIDDQAGVLDTDQIQVEAAKLPNSVLIYTTNTFSGDQSAFNQSTRNRLSDQNSIDIGIDVAQRHLSIQSGTSVPLSDSQASDAINAFKSSYSSGSYTAATIATIDSLLNTLSTGETTPQTNNIPGPDKGTGYQNNGFPGPDGGNPFQNNGFPGFDGGTAVFGVIVVFALVGFIILLMAGGVRKGLRNSSTPPRNWGGSQGRRDRYSPAGTLYDRTYTESQHHQHHHIESNFGGSTFGGGASGSFGDSTFSGGAGSDFGGGSSGGGAGGSF